MWKCEEEGMMCKTGIRFGEGRDDGWEEGGDYECEGAAGPPWRRDL